MNGIRPMTPNPAGPPFSTQFNGPPGGQFQKFQKANSFYVFQPRPPVPPIYQATEFDGKRLRKAIARKTVDYNTSVVKTLEQRIWMMDFRDRKVMQPDVGYYTELTPPFATMDNPVDCITTKFVRTSTNKMRCPIFCVLWTPEGRRLVTGASSGEFTLWNGLTFNFETILQAHDSSVRVMVWGRTDLWMVTADHGGYVKYWQSNMNNVKMFQAHKEPVRAISFCPTDTKFGTCSDDGTIRIWDFLTCTEERILRGHGSDVKGLDWHPSKSLIVSGSKDSQQPIKLWDPKSGQSLATIHAHKSTVMDVKWNQNGNWLLTASRDHLIKIFDIRNMSTDMQTFRGHKKEACCLSWHPIHESLFASGGSDGSILFWLVGTEKEVGGMDQAHDSVVWSLSWHPLGHILASGSNDHTCKFWTRNRPGDKMRDKYNLNLIPKGQEEAEYEDIVTAPSIPGMGLSENDDSGGMMGMGTESNSIPGLGSNDMTNNQMTPTDEEPEQLAQQRKVPFSKPVPKQFQNQWADKKGPLPPGPPPPPHMRDGEVDQLMHHNQIGPPMHPRLLPGIIGGPRLPPFGPDGLPHPHPLHPPPPPHHHMHHRPPFMRPDGPRPEFHRNGDGRFPPPSNMMRDNFQIAPRLQPPQSSDKDDRFIGIQDEDYRLQSINRMPDWRRDPRNKMDDNRDEEGNGRPPLWEASEPGGMFERSRMRTSHNSNNEENHRYSEQRNNNYQGDNDFRNRKRFRNEEIGFNWNRMPPNGAQGGGSGGGSGNNYDRRY